LRENRADRVPYRWERGSGSYCEKTGHQGVLDHVMAVGFPPMPESEGMVIRRLSDTLGGYFIGSSGNPAASQIIRMEAR